MHQAVLRSRSLDRQGDVVDGGERCHGSSACDAVSRRLDDSTVGPFVSMMARLRRSVAQRMPDRSPRTQRSVAIRSE